MAPLITSAKRKSDLIFVIDLTPIQDLEDLSRLTRISMFCSMPGAEHTQPSKLQGAQSATEVLSVYWLLALGTKKT